MRIVYIVLEKPIFPPWYIQKSDLRKNLPIPNNRPFSYYLYLGNVNLLESNIALFCKFISFITVLLSRMRRIDGARAVMGSLCVFVYFAYFVVPVCPVYKISLAKINWNVYTATLCISGINIPR